METEVRVCPFCREPFEGELRCPHHDLELVAPTELEGDASKGLERPRGKGPVIAAALAASGSFFLPFFEDAEGVLPPKSALAVALGGGESLWVCFLVPMVVVGTLFSVDEPATLRRVRLAFVLSSLIAVAAASLALARGLALAELSTGIGAYALLASLVLMGLASLRLGGR